MEMRRKTNKAGTQMGSGADGDGERHMRGEASVRTRWRAGARLTSRRHRGIPRADTRGRYAGLERERGDEGGGKNAGCALRAWTGIPSEVAWAAKAESMPGSICGPGTPLLADWRGYMGEVQAGLFSEL